MITGTSLGIGVTMFLRDQFSGPASKIRNSMSAASSQMRQMEMDQLRQTRNMSAGLAFAGVAALRSMGRMIDKASEYGYMMKFVGVATGAVGDQQQLLEKQAMKTNQATIYSAHEIANSMREMALGGLSIKEINQTITPSAMLAQASMTDLTTTTDILISTMRSFGIETKNSGAIADLLAKASIDSMISLQDLGEALKYTGSTSMDMGISLQETTAMIMALGNAGIKGSMAGVAIENMSRHLALAMGKFGSPNQKKALAAVGLTMADITDQKGNLLSMVEVIEKIGMGMERVFGDDRNVDKQSVLSRLFSVRGKRSASLLIRNLKEFKNLYGQLNKAPGTTEKIVGKLMEELNAQIKKAVTNLGNMKIAFTEALEPTLKFLMKVVSAFANLMTFIFKIPLLGEFLAGGIAGFIAIKTVAMSYKMVMSGIGLLKMQMAAQQVAQTSAEMASWSAKTKAAYAYAQAVAAGSITLAGQGGGLAASRIIAGAPGAAKAGYAVNKAGRVIRAAGTTVGKAGQFVGKAEMLAAAGSLGAGMLAPKVATGLFARALGFIGGPWGIALAFGLPAVINLLIRAFSKNTDETKENSDALKEAARTQQQKDMQYTRMGHMIKFQDLNAPTMRVVGTSAVGQQSLGIDQAQLLAIQKNLQESLANKSMGDINIYLDGDKILSKKVVDIINGQVRNFK